MKISVHCNFDRRGEETPCAFHLGGRRLPVISIFERWTESGRRLFEVSVEDGRRFVLGQDLASRSWELVAVYAATRAPAKSAAARRASPAQRKGWFAR